jgi:hypothetical protein
MNGSNDFFKVLNKAAFLPSMRYLTIDTMNLTTLPDLSNLFT